MPKAPMLSTSPKMGGVSQPKKPPVVADSLSGDYKAVKPVMEMKNQDTSLTGQVSGTSASLQNRKQPNMAMPVLDQSVMVSAKKFVPMPVRTFK